MGYWVIPDFYDPLSIWGSGLRPDCTFIIYVNSNKLWLVSYFILEATHKGNTGVSILTVYISVSHATLAFREVSCSCGNLSSTAISNISHRCVERGGGRFVVNNTENTWLPLGSQSLLRVLEQKTSCPFSGPTLCPEANFRAVWVHEHCLYHSYGLLEAIGTNPFARINVRMCMYNSANHWYIETSYLFTLLNFFGLHFHIDAATTLF